MLAVAQWLFELGALRVCIYPDGMHINQSTFLPLNTGKTSLQLLLVKSRENCPNRETAGCTRQSGSDGLMNQFQVIRPTQLLATQKLRSI